MAVTKVVMPKLSEAMETGKVIKWLRNEGDRVQSGDIVAEIETDKADVEMEAFGAGVLRKILVAAGERAPVGTLIGVIAEPGEDIAPLLAEAARPHPTPPPCGPRSPSRWRSPRRRCRTSTGRARSAWIPRGSCGRNSTRSTDSRRSR